MSVPIGSIVAYAGDIPEDPTARSVFEEGIGWMVCDGRALSRDDPNFSDLFNAIGFNWGQPDPDGPLFRVPDLKGFFLRGIDQLQEFRGPRDRNLVDRFPLYPGGSAGGQVGSYQSFATAQPNVPFTAVEVPDHNPFINVEINASREVNARNEHTLANPWTPASPQFFTDGAGRHSHSVTGGDLETRPWNAYVYWLIRYKTPTPPPC
jgi:Phage Tail Collar Domain